MQFEKTKNHKAFFVLLNYILDSFGYLTVGLRVEITGKFRPRYGSKKVKKQ